MREVIQWIKTLMHRRGICRYPSEHHNYQTTKTPLHSPLQRENMSPCLLNTLLAHSLHWPPNVTVV